MAWISRLLLTGVLSAGAFAVPAVVHSAPDVYVVEDGDYLIGIADKLGVRLADLLEANDLTLSSVIVPGQRLEVPGGSGGGSAVTSGETYTVQAGDTLFGVAARYGVSLASFVEVNNLNAADWIIPGQRLRIPGGGGGGGQSSTPASGGGTYTVQAGDTLFGIAARHGVGLGSLLDLNGLSESSLIVPGQRLDVPAGGRAPSSSGGGSSAVAGGGTYSVRAGDTLSGIADRHQVSLGALLEVNGLSASSMITPGMRLTLPAGAKVSRIDRVLDYAVAQVGKRYRFFTKGPDSFDCSGLTLAAYAQIGVTLIHYSRSQARQGKAVDFWNEPIRAGDLVFLSTTDDDQINHVGIALDSSRMVQARSERLGVQLTGMPSKSSILAVRRFVDG